jgi:outer membrane biosynthesis protein TonB
LKPKPKKPEPIVKEKPKPKPKPQKVAKAKPKPKPKPKIKKRKPKPKLAKVIKKAPVKRPVKVAKRIAVKKPPPKPAAPKVNVANTGVLGALAGIGKKSPKNKQQLVSALTNLSAVKSRGGAQTFSVSGLQGKLDTDDVSIQRIGDLNTKGATGAGNRSYGLASVSGKKGAGLAIGGQVSGSDAIISPTVKGSLSYGEIFKVVQKAISDLQYCYEKELVNNASLGGKLTAVWTIGTSGAVINAKIQKSEVRSGKVHSCVTRTVKRLKFPKPRGGGVVEVSFPFNFSDVAF